jgi:hypothetical protein
MSRRTVAVDFDGVLHSYTSKFDIDRLDPPESGAREFIIRLMQDDFEIVVYSTRAETEHGADVMRRWLRYWDFPEVAMTITSGKPLAVAYVDDRAVSFRRHRGFDDTYDEVVHLAEHGAHCTRGDCSL